MADRDYYVYILCRADGETPFYVGKGKGDRLFEHEKDAKRERSHKAAIIRQMQAVGISVPKQKVAEGLSNAEACALEIKMIAEIGRCPNGPLTNLTSGGEGAVDLSPEIKEKHRRNTSAGQCGRKYSPEWCAAISKALKGRRVSPPTTPEIREKLSASGKRAWACIPIEKRRLRGMAGKRHSEETKAKMRASQLALGRQLSEEQRARISAFHTGRCQSVEERAIRSEAQRKRWSDPEQRLLQSEAMKRAIHGR